MGTATLVRTLMTAVALRGTSARSNFYDHFFFLIHKLTRFDLYFLSVPFCPGLPRGAANSVDELSSADTLPDPGQNSEREDR